MPVIRLAGTAYFIDLSHRHFKETMNPGIRVDFDSVEGQRLCRQAGVVTCLNCGTSAIVAASVLDNELSCLRCKRTLGERQDPHAKKV